MGESLNRTRREALRELEETLRRMEAGDEKDLHRQRVYRWLKESLEEVTTPEGIERRLWAVRTIKDLVEGRFTPTDPEDYNLLAQAIQELTGGRARPTGGLLFLPFKGRESLPMKDVDLYVVVERDPKEVMKLQGVFRALERLARKRGVDLDINVTPSEATVLHSDDIFTLDSVVWPLLNSPAFFFGPKAVRRYSRLNLLVDRLREVKKKNERVYRMNIEELAHRAVNAYIRSLLRQFTHDSWILGSHAAASDRAIRNYLESLPHLRHFVHGWEPHVLERFARRRVETSDIMRGERAEVLADIREKMVELIERELPPRVKEHLRRLGLEERDSERVVERLLELIKRGNRETVKYLRRLAGPTSPPQRTS